MPPTPLPHRVSFLSPVIALAPSEAHLPLLAAKVIQAVTFDYLARHPVVAVEDFNEQKLTDAEHRLLDVRHPQIEAAIDWQFRANRRDEVVWLNISADIHEPGAATLRCRRPDGTTEGFSAPATEPLHVQVQACIDQWLEARKLPPAPAPMEKFFASDIATVIHQLDDALVAEHEGDGTIPVYLRMPPPRLGAAFFLVLQDLCHSIAPAELDAEILELDPDNLIARLNAYHRGEPRDYDALFSLIDEAPMWSKPHLAVFGDAFAGDGTAEPIATRHQGRAVTLAPSNPWANRGYALELGRASRTEEALRWSQQSTRVDPGFWIGHIESVRLARRCGRVAESLAIATKRCSYVLDMYRQGHAAGHDPEHAISAGMQLAFAHEDVGRLDEAVEIGASTVHEAESPPPWAVDQVQAWCNDPDVLCNAFARDAYYRGEPGRVIEGFGFGGLDKSTDIAMLIESLIAVGREDIALYAFAHYRDARLQSPRARLAGAMAHILAGDLVEAMEQIQICQLRFSQSRVEGEINRLLRLATSRSIKQWEQVVERYLTLGTPTLARMAARDIADFVPAAANSAIIARALGDATTVERPATWLDSLRAAVADQLDVAAVDAILAHPVEDTRTAADLLLSGWFAALPSRDPNPDAFAAGAIYALGGALTSYLALSAGPPNVIAGAYRYIATEALELVRNARSRIRREWIRGLFEALEQLAFARDDDFDRWVLRIERALGFQAHAGGYAPQIIAGLPRTADYLRGDERVAFEMHMAYDLAADEATGEPARVLFERSQRATETGAAAVHWSALADATLDADAALDVHWVAALCNPGNHAGPWLNLARVLFDRGRGLDAVSALAHAFPPADADWRLAQIDALRSRWENADDVAIPIDARAAYERGLELVDSDPTTARRCFRWAVAADPTIDGVRDELARAIALTGKVTPTIREYSKIDAKTGPLRAAEALVAAGHRSPAVRAYRYASLYFTTAAEWVAFAEAASAAGDVSTAVDAYDELIVHFPEAATVSVLSGFGAALSEVGDHQRCTRIAEQLTAFGAAEAAAKLQSSIPTLEPGTQPAALGAAAYDLDDRAFEALRAGDTDKVQTLAAEGDSWQLFRAAMAASETRTGSPDEPPVPSAALAAADHVLEKSAGATSTDAVLAHIRALRVMEDAHIGVDPPPPLGTRMTDERFREELARRRESS